MTTTQMARIGVCIVRVETQSENLLISVTTRRDIGSKLHSALEERPRYFTEADDALAVILHFLYSFQGHEPPDEEPASRQAGK
jgi:hypothetical protein